MMERWELIPLKSIGKIEFGMDRDEVHRLLGDNYTEFKKSKFSKNTTDDYGKFHVFYTRNNKVDAVEFFEGIEIVLDGKVIFPIVSDKIESSILGIVREGDSFTHAKKAIGLEVEAGKAESILVGSEGYFE